MAHTISCPVCDGSGRVPVGGLKSLTPRMRSACEDALLYSDKPRHRTYAAKVIELGSVPKAAEAFRVTTNAIYMALTGYGEFRVPPL